MKKGLKRGAVGSGQIGRVPKFASVSPMARACDPGSLPLQGQLGVDSFPYPTGIGSCG